MLKFKVLQQLPVLHVATGPGPLDELEEHVNCNASGDGTLFIEVDALQESEATVAKELLKVIPDDFNGIVYLTR